MKFLTQSVVLLLSATAALSGECGWERTLEGGVLENHWQGSCGGGTTCIKNQCVAFAKLGEACSESKPCATAHSCDSKTHVCTQKNGENVSCSNNSECQSDICLNEECRSTKTCGSTSDCGNGKVCRFTTVSSNVNTIERTVRVCATPDVSKYGEDCESDADCGVYRYPTEEELREQRRKGSKSGGGLLGGLLSGGGRVGGSRGKPGRKGGKTTARALPFASKEAKTVQLQCRAGLCLLPKTLHADKTFNGWPCRTDAHCRSGHCKASTFKDDKLTIKTCANKETQS
ncbi:hypothetical protein GTR04_3080 [Trichophyton interdigitale]|uniref:Dickkopf N-terminal cysteine-rich domain-containing protein n=1 Tax=Trichophyton interdigitale TaxID=101480 RepID=A0A9P4YF92_9EURO|nr:hypothetical protein GY631_3830 [Trichophyton interdigitale]KAF3894921.1 hypothetical protein GY632_3518 [Trichophyton interdigitale]KAG8209533.1 hypothetical protein GTR04_3080 [Trichophyton interdigitale]